MSQQVTASPLFSLQIDPSPDLTTLVEDPIMMMFDVVHNIYIYIYIYINYVATYFMNFTFVCVMSHSKLMFRIMKTLQLMMYLVTFMTLI